MKRKVDSQEIETIQLRVDVQARAALMRASLEQHPDSDPVRATG